KRRYADAARLYAAAFAAQPKFAADRPAQDRYNAACAATLAGVGQGIDAGKLDDRERDRLRQQAHAWLRAELAASGPLVEEGPRGRASAPSALRGWQTDSDLGGVRDPERLAKLPPEEQAAWQKLWAEVSALLRRAAPPKAPPAIK